jgi:hypothetical protein
VKISTLGHYIYKRHQGPKDFTADCVVFPPVEACVKCGEKPENPNWYKCYACLAEPWKAKKPDPKRKKEPPMVIK